MWLGRGDDAGPGSSVSRSASPSRTAGPPSPRPPPRRRHAQVDRAGGGEDVQQRRVGEGDAPRRGRAGRPAGRRPPYGSGGRRRRRPAPARTPRGRPPARGGPGRRRASRAAPRPARTGSGPTRGRRPRRAGCPSPALIACTVPGPIGEVWPVESVCSRTPRQHPGDDLEVAVRVVGIAAAGLEQVVVVADQRTEAEVGRVVVRTEGERVPRHPVRARGGEPRPIRRTRVTAMPISSQRDD